MTRANRELNGNGTLSEQWPKHRSRGAATVIAPGKESSAAPRGRKVPAAPKSAEKKVVISAPRMQVMTLAIVGTSPYVGHKFSAKALAQIRETQAEGQSAKNRNKRDPKDFEGLFHAATHRSVQGWCGIPAAAFRSACIDACRLVGFKMTIAKCSIFVLADGFDDTEGTPLVKIIGKAPERLEQAVRNDNGSVDIRVRPMWREWRAKVRVQFDLDQFTPQAVANLMLRAGMQVGIGEGRPSSKMSHGQGWGTFTLEE